MSDAAEKLLRIALQGTAETLRQHLEPLDPGQRKALFAMLKKPVEALRSRCRRNDDSSLATREVEVARVVAAIPHPAGVDAALEALEDGRRLWLRGRAATRLFINLQCLQVGLAGSRTAAAAGLKRAWDCPDQGKRGDSDESFLLRVGRVLIDRPEPWRRELFLELMEKHDRWVAYGSTVAPLVQEVKGRESGWRAEIVARAGRVITRDAFYVGEQKLEQYDQDLLLAGFEYEERSEPTRSPILLDRVPGQMLALSASGHIDRAALLDLTLGNLAAPHKKSVTAGWGRFLERLAAEPTELSERQEQVLDLLHASEAASAGQGLAIVERQWRDGALPAPELIGALGPALQHATQKIARGAFELVKKIARQDLPLTLEVAGADVVDALSSPHKGLRTALIAWLGKVRPVALPAELRSRAVATAIDMDPRERKLVLELFPEAAGEAVAADAATPSIEPGFLESPATEVGGRAPAVWRSHLQSRRDGGAPEALAAIRYCHADALRGEAFPYPAAAEELARELAGAATHGLTPAGRERALIGILRYRGEWDERVSRLVSPLDAALSKSIRARAELVEQWRKSSSARKLGPDSFPQHDDDYLAALLAAWRGQKSDDRQPPNSPWQARIEQVIQRLTGGGGGVLLAAPTHRAGWIAPEAFAERYLALAPTEVGDEDLIAALHRLPAVADARERAWSALAGRCRGAHDSHARAVTLALGPAELAVEAARAMYEGLAPAPELGRYNRAHEAMASSDFQRRTPFRLLIAGIVARDGWRDLRTSYPFLADVTGRARVGSFLDIAADSWVDGDDLLVETFLNPEPITREWLARMTLRPTNKEILERWPDAEVFALRSSERTLFPHLMPYLLVSASPGLHGDPFDEDIFLERYLLEAPACAQRIFEAACLRTVYLKNDAKPALLLAGRRAWVDPLPGLDATLELWLGKFPHHRERAVELLSLWLADGRVTPADGVAAIARTLARAAKGFKYAVESLRSLAASGGAGLQLAIGGMEKTLVERASDLPPRNLSMLLEELYLRLEETAAGASADAAAALIALAGAKKKSTARTKAAEIVELTAGRDPLDREAAILAALLGDAGPG